MALVPGEIHLCSYFHMVMAAGKPLELKQPQGGSEATPLYSCVYLFFHFLKFNRQLPLTFMLFISPANIFQKACMEDFTAHNFF